MVFGYIHQIYHNNRRVCKEESSCESMSINHQSELLSKSLCSSSNHSKEKENNFGGNLYFVYVLLGILYFSTIAIAVTFMCYANRLNDLSALREHLRNEFIVNDIKHIVQIVLKDVKNEHQPVYKLSER